MNTTSNILVDIADTPLMPNLPQLEQVYRRAEALKAIAEISANNVIAGELGEATLSTRQSFGLLSAINLLCDGILSELSQLDYQKEHSA